MLIETAAKLWQREEGDYRDDVSNKNIIVKQRQEWVEQKLLVEYLTC